MCRTKTVWFEKLFRFGKHELKLLKFHKSNFREFQKDYIIASHYFIIKLDGLVVSVLDTRSRYCGSQICCVNHTGSLNKTY